MSCCQKDSAVGSEDVQVRGREKWEKRKPCAVVREREREGEGGRKEEVCDKNGSKQQNRASVCV